MTATRFALSERIDRAALRRRFAATGRVEVPDLVPAGQSAALRAHLRSRSDWLTVVNAGDKVYEVSRSALAAMSAEQRTEFDARIARAARDDFQFRFDSIRVPDRRDTATGPCLLTEFVDFMGSAPVVDLLAGITRCDDIAFADGQATAYAPGDFLTRHDDAIDGKGRRAAYVFGLSPGWRAEWGGLLMFHGDDGNIAEAFSPAMGALRLFAVPVVHSVSYVAPFAPEPRLSVTGWLRTAAGRG